MPLVNGEYRVPIRHQADLETWFRLYPTDRRYRPDVRIGASPTTHRGAHDRLMACMARISDDARVQRAPLVKWWEIEVADLPLDIHAEM